MAGPSLRVVVAACVEVATGAAGSVVVTAGSLAPGATVTAVSYSNSFKAPSALVSSDLKVAFCPLRMKFHPFFQSVRRAFVEFLTIPTLVIAGFLLAALVTHTLDRSGSATLKWGGLFSEPEATRDFLSVIASGIITVTTMTFSLLLIAVQQGAAALTSLVLDQFIRRKVNQFYFGFFVGLALYSLIILASMGPSHQPHLGVALAGLMTAAALYMLIFLIYSTINQMRPVVILRSIHGHTLMARTIQLDLMRRTRREPRLQGDPIAHVTAECNGSVTRLDFATIASAVAGSSAEVVILPSIGDYVTFGDPIAEIRAATPGRDVLELDRVIRTAVEVEEQRDLDGDPAFGIEQIVTIGWTSISTAKSNPDPGLLAIFDLRDLLARWVQSDEAFGPELCDLWRSGSTSGLFR